MSAGLTSTAELALARPAVFIDKDGTLVENIPFNVDPERLRFTPTALEALQALARAGFALIVVTNQPGIASGRFTRRQFAQLQRALCARLRAEAGVELTAFEFCPHRPAVGGGPGCSCRKPAPGMLRRAAQANGLDLPRSWMIGDILDDVEAGRRAGCRTILLDVGNETVWRRSRLREPDYRCRNLLEAASFITGQATAEARAS